MVTGDLPTGDLPTGDLPTGDLPIGDLPTGDLPIGDLPATPLHPAPDDLQTLISTCTCFHVCSDHCHIIEYFLVSTNTEIGDLDWRFYQCAKQNFIKK